MIKCESPELEGPIFCLSFRLSPTPINLFFQLVSSCFAKPQLCGTPLNYMDLEHCWVLNHQRQITLWTQCTFWDKIFTRGLKIILWGKTNCVFINSQLIRKLNESQHDTVSILVNQCLSLECRSLKWTASRGLLWGKGKLWYLMKCFTGWGFPSMNVECT